MESIEQRAKSYATGCGAILPEICAFDYIAGAREQHLLLTEWRVATQVQSEVGKRVLCKLNNQEVRTGMYRADGYWCLDGLAIYPTSEQILWRPIHELKTVNK